MFTEPLSHVLAKAGFVFVLKAQLNNSPWQGSLDCFVHGETTGRKNTLPWGAAKVQMWLREYRAGCMFGQGHVPPLHLLLCVLQGRQQCLHPPSLPGMRRAAGGSQSSCRARDVAPAPAASPASPNKALLQILVVSCRVVAKCGISEIFLEQVCSL